MVRATVLPRRLTQLFADNKKSYEALVNNDTRRRAPELSHLLLRLRIQKDRLIAWGIQWSDRSVGHGEDIDKSLDRAGISDLVASIMCSIRLLLDEAEALQPDALERMGERSDEKMLTPPSSLGGSSYGEWTESSLKRLEEILRDLTTSVDTLCDLSRPRLDSTNGGPSSSKGARVSPDRAPSSRKRRGDSEASPIEPVKKSQHRDLPSRRDGLADMTYLDPRMFRLQTEKERSTSAPPSYESIVAGSDDRFLATFSPSPSPQSPAAAPSASEETLVLLDYGKVDEGSPQPGVPDTARFEELLLALLKLSTAPSAVSAGIMKLTGWTVDADRRKYAYAYEVPRPKTNPSPPTELQPRTLLSFLQNSGDADSTNMPCLENRFRLALNLTTCVKHLHNSNVAHKNINSNNLLYFLAPDLARSREKVWRSAWIRTPYLAGFHPRGVGQPMAEQDTSLIGFYYHPRLFGPNKVAYNLMHDYYSLGLVLLEIGLWMPIGKFWKSKYTLSYFKAKVQDLYVRKLASKCGDGYMNAVLFCLTAADTIGRSLNMMDFATASNEVITCFQHNVVTVMERCCRIEGDTVSPSLLPATPGETPEPQAEPQAEPGETRPILALRKETSRSTVSEQSTQTGNTSEFMSTPTLAAQHHQKQIPECLVKVWSHTLPDLYSSYWSSNMWPKLDKILRKALSRWESYAIDLIMAGDDPDTARPTIYMECASTLKVQRILRFLNKDLRLFDIKVASGGVVRSKVAKKKRRSGKKKVKAGLNGAAVQNLNPHFLEKPRCGASIGAYLDGNHLPPVTFGGTLLLNEEPYGMSVHHMLEDEDEIQAGLEHTVDLHRSMAPAAPIGRNALNTQENEDSYSLEGSEASDADEISSDGYAFSDFSHTPTLIDSPPEALYPFEIPFEMPDRWADNEDDPVNDFWLSPSFDLSRPQDDDSDDDDECDLGDTAGIMPDASAAPMVTQPALDDVCDGFFPCANDAAEEHLASHTLGHVHASSGLRRIRTPEDGKLHEIDWALIRIHPTRLASPLNQHPTPSLEASSSESEPPAPPLPVPSRAPTAIIPSESLPSLTVHAHARSAGAFARGTILPAMRLVRLPGRTSPSHSWPVRGGFGAGGDSGAWVFDDRSGALCGHVLAYSERSQVAYIAPMELQIRDIERVLGGKVGLPGAEPEEAAVEGRRPSSPMCPTSPPMVLGELESSIELDAGGEARALAKGKALDLPLRQASSTVAAVV